MPQKIETNKYCSKTQIEKKNAHSQFRVKQTVVRWKGNKQRSTKRIPRLETAPRNSLAGVESTCGVLVSVAAVGARCYDWGGRTKAAANPLLSHCLLAFKGMAARYIGKRQCVAISQSPRVVLHHTWMGITSLNAPFLGASATPPWLLTG